MVWYSHLFQKFPQFIVIHTVKGFGIVNKAAIDIFWNSCFFSDPADVGSLISGSSAFCKTSLNIWKFTVHILLKPGLENFEHYYFFYSIGLNPLSSECDGCLHFRTEITEIQKRCSTLLRDIQFERGRTLWSNIEASFCSCLGKIG